jgi:hypothetical protein
MGPASPALRRAVMSVLPLAALAACTGSLNTSDELLDAPPLPALSAPRDEPLPPSAGQPSIGAATGLDRRSWPVVEVSSPRGQVQVQPTYVTTFAPDRSLARDRGEFPTGATVLETTGSGDAQFWEAAANVGGTPLLIPVAPVSMIMGRWWWVTERDLPTYARLPAAQAGASAGGEGGWISAGAANPWIWVEPPAPPAQGGAGSGSP